jgi:hypothetical protein
MILRIINVKNKKVNFKRNRLNFYYFPYFEICAGKAFNLSIRKASFESN